MQKIILAGTAILFFMVLSSVVLAKPIAQSMYGALCNELDANRHYIWLPDSVAEFFHGKAINLDFLMGTGETWRLNGIVNGNGIGQLKCDHEIQCDYQITMSDKTAIELATSFQPIRAFVAYWKAGAIGITANGNENTVALAEGEKLLLAEDDEPVPESIRNYFDQYSR